MSGHKKPVTRRDFMAAGLVSGSGYIMLPTVLDILLNSAISQAQVCPPLTGASTMPALITIDAVGGACFAWDIPPLDSGGQVLNSYGKLGLGNQATAVAGMTPSAFANAIKISGPGTMIPQIVTTLGTAASTILPNTMCIPIWSSSRDDSSTVGNDIQNAAIAAGLFGKLKLLGSSSSSTGLSNVDAFNIVPNTPFVPKKVSDVVNSLGSPASGAFGILSQPKKNAIMNIIKNLNTNEAQRLAAAQGGQTAANLIGCAHDVNTTIVKSPPTGDPRTSPIATTWGLTAATQDTATNAVQAAMVLAALTGNSGPVGFQMGGYDYHGQGQTTQNTKHQALGTLIGQILASAQILNKDTFIYLLTDGATSTTDSAAVAAPQNDSGQNGGNVMFMFKAGSPPPPASKNQVGYFDATTQQNASSSPSENIQLGAASALINYLAFAGGMAKVNTLSTLVPSLNLTAAQITQLLALSVS